MARRAIPSDDNFETALLGYHRNQVDRHIDELEQRLADAVVAFDAAVALQTQLNEARREIRQLRQEQVGERVYAILAAAEQQAAVIRAEAQKDAAKQAQHRQAQQVQQAQRDPGPPRRRRGLPGRRAIARWQS